MDPGRSDPDDGAWRRVRARRDSDARLRRDRTQRKVTRVAGNRPVGQLPEPEESDDGWRKEGAEECSREGLVVLGESSDEEDGPMLEEYGRVVEEFAGCNKYKIV